jgi:uncharacterized protein with WD repeat
MKTQGIILVIAVLATVLVTVLVASTESKPVYAIGTNVSSANISSTAGNMTNSTNVDVISNATIGANTTEDMTQAPTSAPGSAPTSSGSTSDPIYAAKKKFSPDGTLKPPQMITGKISKDKADNDTLSSVTGTKMFKIGK